MYIENVPLLRQSQFEHNNKIEWRMLKFIDEDVKHKCEN